VTVRRVCLKDPKIGTGALQAVSHATEAFAPGHFIKMTDDEQASRPDFETFPCGMRVAPAAQVLHQADPGSVQVAWETCYPHEQMPRLLELLDFARLNRAIASHGTILGHSAIAAAVRNNGNPYLPVGPRPDDGVSLQEVGQVSVMRGADLSLVADAPQRVSTMQAAGWLALHPEVAAGTELVAAASLEGVFA
jgi:hypothetical protein